MRVPLCALALSLGLAAGAARADTLVLEHTGANDPATEGWTVQGPGTG